MSIENEPLEMRLAFVLGQLTVDLTRLDLKRDDWEKVRDMVDRLYAAELLPLRKP